MRLQHLHIWKKNLEILILENKGVVTLLRIQVIYYEVGFGLHTDIKSKESVFIANDYFINQGCVLEIHLEDGRIKGIPLSQIKQYRVTEELNVEDGEEVKNAIREKKTVQFEINVEQYYIKQITPWVPYTWSKERTMISTMKCPYLVKDYSIQDGSVLEMQLMNGCILGIPLCQIRVYEVRNIKEEKEKRMTQ